eukprot:TRINITY_DN2704_c0_g1_i2.p1 TRINITY_DN2704_c0_g1~~TRINITY_DN2704_c0_g1_i2.p1  ORF type:complete len:108 (-),score=25.06 TRINITY_DN2704_c0_g1_i2:3-326(-)
MRERESDFAFEYIRKAPNNPSPWGYLKGLFNGQKYSENPELKEKLIKFRETNVTSPHPVSLLVDIYQEENNAESVQKATELCKILETTLDTLHHKYWVYRAQNLVKS